MSREILIIFTLIPCILKSQYRIDTLTYNNNYGYTLIYSNNGDVIKEEEYGRDNYLRSIKEFTKDSIKERTKFGKDVWELHYSKNGIGVEGNVFVYDNKNRLIVSGKFVRNISSFSLDYEGFEATELIDNVPTVTSETFYLCSYYKNLQKKKCYCQEGYSYNPEGEYTEYYRNGKKSMRGNYEFADIKTGIWQHFYFNGNLKSEGEYETYDILSNPTGDSAVLKTIYRRNGIWKYYSRNKKRIKEKEYRPEKPKNAG